MPRAIALFSGGLDSSLAVRILQRQQFEVDALHVRTTFACCRTPAAQSAAALGVELTVHSVADDYLDVIRHPVHGYGRGLNPCVDCRIYMCKVARRLMLERGACLVVTGEILGQRPMSQKRMVLNLIERAAGLEGRLLRPLCARLLAPTIPEAEGLVDRQRLFAFSGRSRKGLIKLAGELGVGAVPSASTGCALTEAAFAPRVRDLLAFRPAAGRWDFELLKTGRHVRVDAQTKVVLGRNAEENASLARSFAQADAAQCALVIPEGFQGPSALVVGPAGEDSLRFAGALILRYAKGCDGVSERLRVLDRGTSRLVRAARDPRAEAAAAL